MSALGSLVVKLGLDYAQYTGGLDKSEQAALAAAKKIQDTFDNMKSKVAATAGAVAGGLAAGFTIAAFKSIISGSIETGAALDDLRMQTGATVESLSGLVAVGKFNNMGAEQIGGAMNKLAANLAGATEESKGTAKAIEALGLDFDKFKKLRPEEQMQTVAKAMAQFEDGTGKSAIAMAFYGKQGAQMLPFLHDLAEVGELQAKVSTEQAAAAANLDDNLTRLTTSGDAWKKELANGMIPALDLGAQALLDVMNGSGGLREEVRRLVADGSIAQWTKSAITGLTYVADAAQYVMRGVKVLAESLGAYAAAGAAYFGGVGEAIGKALRGDFLGALATVNSGATRAKSIMSDLGGSIIQTFGEDTLGSRIRARMGEIEATGGAAKEARKQLEFVNANDKVGKAAAEAKDPYDALRDAVVKATAAFQAELAAGEKLTEGQKKAVEVLDQLRTGKVKVTEAQAVQIGQDIEAMLAAERENKAREEFIKSAEIERAARLKIAQVAEQSAASLDEQNRALKEEIELIGLTDAAQLRVLQRRNETIILTKEATLAELERASALTGTMTREQIALQAEIEALRERNQLLGAKFDKTVVAKAAEEASNEWRQFTDSVYNSLSDSLYRSFEAGKGFFKTFWDGIKNTAKTTVLKFAVQGVMTGVTGALGLGATAANAASGGGASAVGMASNAYSLYNMGSQAWTLGSQYLSGSMSGANALGTMWANGTGGGLDALLATNGAYGTAGAGAGGAGITGLAGAGAFAAVAAVVLNALGAFRSERKVGGGLAGTLGSGQITPWEEWREGGTLFSGPSYSTMNPLAELERARARLAELQKGAAGDGTGNPQAIATQQLVVDQLEATYGGLADATAKQSKTIQAAYDAMRNSAGDMADALGLSSEKARSFTTQLGGTKGLNFEGLKPEEQQAKLAEALATANNEIAQQIIGTWVTTTSDVSRIVSENIGSVGEDMSMVYSQLTDTVTTTRYVASEYAKDGERAIDTLKRLSTSLTTVNAIWENLGYTVYEATLAGADAASAMAEAFGGLDKMVAATSSYIDKFYTDKERRANTERQLRDALDKFGLALPDINSQDARAQWRALAESQDRSTEEGRKAYVMLMSYSDAFASVTTSLEDAAQAQQQQAEAAQRAAEESARAAADAQKQMLEAQRDALDLQRQLVEETLSNLQGLFDLVSSTAREMFGEVDELAAMQAAEGRAFIAQALATARASGYLPEQDQLADAISAARGGIDKGAYASGAVQDYERMVVANQLRGLEAIIGPQKTAAEQQLEVLKAQLKSIDDTVKAVNGTTGAVYNLNSALSDYDQQKRIEAVRSAFSSFSDDPLRVASISRAAGWSMQDLATAFDMPLSQVQSYFAEFGISNFSDGATLSMLESRYAEMKSMFASFSDDPWRVYNISRSKGWTTADIAAAYKMPLQQVRDYYLAQGIPAFATGAAFTNGIATRPTLFNMAQMGEVQPEGILPLANVGGKLGVYAKTGGSNDRLVAALIKEVQVLQSKLDVVIERQEEGNDSTQRHADQFENWTMGGRGSIKAEVKVIA